MCRSSAALFCTPPAASSAASMQPRSRPMITSRKRMPSGGIDELRHLEAAGAADVIGNQIGTDLAARATARRRARSRSPARARCPASRTSISRSSASGVSSSRGLVVLLAVLLEEVLHEQRDVVLALAQRRQLHGDDVQAVEQSPRGTCPRPSSRCRSTLVAAMMRTSTLIVSTPPSRMNSRSWITRSSLACVSSGMLPISSKKIVPLSASSNRPFFGYTAPVNAPLTWPKRFDSSRSGGRLPELTVMNALVGARRVLVQRARDQLLAGAALAVDQDRRPARRRLDDQVEHRRMRALRPMISPNRLRAPAGSAAARGSRATSRRCAIALRSTTSTSSFLNGLVM